MEKIKLLCVENLISRRAAGVQQKLSLLMLVENCAFEKDVSVTWAGENGIWQHLPALHQSNIDDLKEYWVAQQVFDLSTENSLPGNIQFALRYRVGDDEYWDNNNGNNYSVQADCGVRTARDIPILNVRFENGLTDGQTAVPITVAINQCLEAKKVTIHWSQDNWQSTHNTPCRYQRNYWDREFSSNARNPNHYGTEIWNGTMKTGETPHVQYRITSESAKGIFWDDNFGMNYSIHRGLLRVLILNLHCYQEDNQNHKFSQIARAINKLNVDVVCLQEVAEHWNNGMGDWESNAARIINSRLKSPYHLATDWSHLGFDRYREGVAILSRYPIARQEGRYVSESHDRYNIHARKVVMAQIKIPYFGLINFFSSHLSWWDDGFALQFDTLRQWASAEHSRNVRATMLCGDFNIKAGSKGYQHVANSKEYEDQFLAANSPQIFRMLFDVGDPRWHGHLKNDHRIDYVFLRRPSELRVTSSQEIFTDKDYGRVSDHCGYLMSFEPK